MLEHEHFEEMCALAATHQLSREEEKVFKAHLGECEPCRAACQQFSLIFSELPCAERRHLDKAVIGRIEKSGFREQFVQRARRAGIRFSDVAEKRLRTGRWRFPPLIPSLHWSHYQTVAASVLFGALVGLGGYRQFQRSKMPPVHAPQVTAVAAVRADDGNAAIAALRAELEKLRRTSEQTTAALKNQNAVLLEKVDGLGKERVGAQAEKQEVQQAMSRLSETNVQLASQNEQEAQVLAETKEELAKAQSDRTAMAEQLGAQKLEMAELSREMRLQTATLDHERELLAAGHDVTNLMGARNLHMIDVYDADGKGKNRKSFGRVFYTEGKSLIFYAFDLDEKKVVNAKYTYQAWGERLGQAAPVRSLGILYMDDKEQKRWALKVDDPRALAEIDAVFVTLEPHSGNGEKPQGRKLLYAFLSGAPNHP